MQTHRRPDDDATPMIDRMLLIAATLATLLALVLLRTSPSPLAPRATAALTEVLDDDRDGRVCSDELARHSDGVLPLEVLDPDGSGCLSPPEVERLLDLSPLAPQRVPLPTVR